MRTKKGNQLHSKGNKLPFFENAEEARECCARAIGNALRVACCRFDGQGV